MKSTLDWIHVGEADPAYEIARSGKSTSVIVFALDEDMEIYIARQVIERNGSTYWLEESLSGVNTVIPNVIMWAYKPKM